MLTADILTLRAAQQIAFDEMREVIRRKVESLKKYADKPDANQNYLDRENKFLEAVSNYVNATESLMEQVDLRKSESDELIKEAYAILTEAEQLTSANTNGQEETH